MRLARARGANCKDRCKDRLMRHVIPFESIVRLARSTREHGREGEFACHRMIRSNRTTGRESAWWRCDDVGEIGEREGKGPNFRLSPRPTAYPLYPARITRPTCDLLRRENTLQILPPAFSPPNLLLHRSLLIRKFQRGVFVIYPSLRSARHLCLTLKEAPVDPFLITAHYFITFHARALTLLSMNEYPGTRSLMER